MSFTPPIARTRHLARRARQIPRLPLALLGATILAIILTVVSVMWYTMDGSSKLDLSRPGYEQERSEVRTSDTQKTYDTTGPITDEAIDAFLKEYDQRAKELGEYGTFAEGVLDDSDIRLTAQTGANSPTE